MKKQTAALREVNDSRLKIYEQLEVSIQDLERANHRLVVENTGDKKLIKKYVYVYAFSVVRLTLSSHIITFRLKNFYDNDASFYLCI